MELEHSFTVPVPKSRAWDVLLDVERVAPCMPGATLDSVDGDEIRGRIKVKVGPINMMYAGTARFIERDEEAGVVTLEASGKETRGAGTASASVKSVLEDHGDETFVKVLTTLNVTGKPAQFGRGVMNEVGGKLLGIFAANLAATLAEDSGGSGGGSSAGGSAGGGSAGGGSTDGATAGRPGYGRERVGAGRDHAGCWHRRGRRGRVRRGRVRRGRVKRGRVRRGRGGGAGRGGVRLDRQHAGRRRIDRRPEAAGARDKQPAPGRHHDDRPARDQERGRTARDRRDRPGIGRRHQGQADRSWAQARSAEGRGGRRRGPRRPGTRTWVRPCAARVGRPARGAAARGRGDQPA